MSLDLAAEHTCFHVCISSSVYFEGSTPHQNGRSASDRVSGYPDTQIPGDSGIRIARFPEIRYPGTRISGNPGMRIARFPEIRLSDARISGNPAIRIAGFPEIRVSGYPDSGNPAIRIARFPKSEYPDTRIPEIRLSG